MAIGLPKIVWEPIPGTSQELAINSPADDTLYCGSRGPGKTITQLMFFKKYVGQGYGKHLRGIIFDAEYKHLDDIVGKIQLFFPQFDDGFKFGSSKGDYTCSWPTGEKCFLRAGSVEEDYDQFHGHEYPILMFNELTKQATPKFFDKIQSCNRSSFVPELHSPKDRNGRIKRLVPPMPLKNFSTTNSTGPGRNWVKQRYIDPVPYGKLQYFEDKVFNPRTKQEEIIRKSRVALFGSYKENIYLDPKYIATLQADPDPIRRKSWLTGSWDITTGGAFDDLWNREKHVIPTFAIPKGWKIDRAYDWGSSKPYACGWFAVANGEEAILPNGARFCPPKGTLILVDEVYGTTQLGTNEGVKKSARDQAIQFRNREQMQMMRGFYLTQPRPGPADNQIRQVREINVPTIESEMELEGVYWENSDKSSGSRIVGMQLFRDRLGNVLANNGFPGFYVMAHCKAWISTVPVLQRDKDNPDDVDTDAEDHLWDVTRYRVLAQQDYTSSLQIAYPT